MAGCVPTNVAVSVCGVCDVCVCVHFVVMLSDVSFDLPYYLSIK